MPDAADHFDAVANLVDSLTELGLEPILVGGMGVASDLQVCPNNRDNICDQLRSGRTV